MSIAIKIGRLRVGCGSSGSAVPDGAPSGLTLTVTGATTITATFSSTSTNQDGYRIYISSDMGTTYIEKGTSLTTSYNITGLTADTYYLFYVVSYKGSVESTPSDTAGIYSGLWYLGGGISAANAIGIYCPVGKANLAASYVNEVTPGTYNLTPVVAPTFDNIEGWIFNGAQSLETGILPVNNQQWSMIIRYSAFIYSGVQQCLAGSFDTSKQFRLTLGKTTTNNMIFGNGSEKSLGTSNYRGFIAVCGKNEYFNGIDLLNDIAAGTGNIARTVLVGTMNYSTTPWFFTGKIQAVAIYNTPLTLDQQLKVSYHLLLKFER